MIPPYNITLMSATTAQAMPNVVASANGICAYTLSEMARMRNDDTELTM